MEQILEGFRIDLTPDPLPALSHRSNITCCKHWKHNLVRRRCAFFVRGWICWVQFHAMMPDFVLTALLSMILFLGIGWKRIDDMPPKCEQDNRQFGWKGQLRRLYNFAQLKVGVALEQEPTYSCVVGSCSRSNKKQDQNHSYQSVNRLIFFWTSSLVTSLPNSPQVLKISFQELRYVGLHVEWHDEFHPEGFLFKSWRFKFYPSFPARWAPYQL